MKRCPYCAEQIQDEAIKCKHCGSTLSGRDTASLDASLRAGGSGSDSRHDTLDAAVTQSGHANILAGQYRIVKKLGEGGMGIVYLAEDMELADRSVAIKVLPPVLSKNTRAVENLRREALTAISLNHPNIIRLYGFHSDEEIKFLVMEYIEGQTLEEVLTARADHRLTFEECVRIVEQVASALDYAHGQKPAVVHRDLKPSNIMIDRQGVAKVLDFGIAREMKDSYTRVTGQQTSGTLPYMSPEQLRGKNADPEMDIYALGAVCYECLSGRTPFHTGDLGYQIIHEAVPPLEGAPHHVNAALQNALAKEPQDRPRSAVQLVTALKGDRPVAAPPRPQAAAPQAVASPPPVYRPSPQPAPVPAVAPPPVQARPAQGGPVGRIRTVGNVILLSVFTFGVYYVIWFYSLWREARRFIHHHRDMRIPPPGAATFAHVVIPIVCGWLCCAVFFSMIDFDSIEYGGGMDEPSPETALTVLLLMVVGGAMAILGAFRLPGLVRKMELAKGVDPNVAGHYGTLGLLIFIPYAGWLIWMGMTQSAVNAFWRKQNPEVGP